MPMERSRSDRGRDMSQSYTHVGKYPAQMSVAGFMGYLKGKAA